MTKEWFAVSREGLRELQENKPKAWILRELIANAFDEDISKCTVEMKFSSAKKNALIIVEDNSPEGFRDLRDAYTLFGKTYKRFEADKRGRFNIGEKQVIAICDFARITTTKGTIIFDRGGRHSSSYKIEKGSIIHIQVKMKKAEYEELENYANQILVPKGILLIVNGKEIPYREPYQSFESILMTEIDEGQGFRRTSRKTTVNLYNHNDGKRYLYELGIPVQEIDCEYHIDVQQKIPLTLDRDNVLPSFLQDVYAEVLNHTHTEISPESSSKLWVREGTSDERASTDAVRSVIKKRYGDKVVIANPKDKRSIDEALANGYKVVYGSEMSKEEWNKVREAEAMKSSTEMFGISFAESERVEPDENMQRVGEYAKRLARRLLDIDIKVVFLKSSKATAVADFGDCTLRFNVSHLNGYFQRPLVETTGLILHEIAHYKGHHTEETYHECLTDMAQALVKIALEEPGFFKERKGINKIKLE